VDALPSPALRDTVLQVIKLLVYAALLPPARYGVTRRLPFLGLGRTPFVTRTPVTRYSPVLGAMAEILFGRVDSLGAIRRNNAQRVLDAVADLPEISAITPPADSEAVYVRLPLLARDREMRDQLIKSLNAAGVGATISYPSAVVDIPELRARLDARDMDCPTARSVSERIFTLPTHPFVEATHVQRMSDTVRRVASGATVGGGFS
jgi:dTDP-4-amino-4,6-dideoxygalactose transaminase